MRKKYSEKCTELGVAVKKKESTELNLTEPDPCCNDARKSGMGLKGDHGIHVKSMKAMAEAKEAGRTNGKVWVDHKRTFATFKRKIIDSFGETFYYDEKAGIEWRGVQSTRYKRYHIKKSMRFLEANMVED